MRQSRPMATDPRQHSRQQALAAANAAKGAPAGDTTMTLGKVESAATAHAAAAQADGANPFTAAPQAGARSKQRHPSTSGLPFDGSAPAPTVHKPTPDMNATIATSDMSADAELASALAASRSPRQRMAQSHYDHSYHPQPSPRAPLPSSPGPAPPAPPPAAVPPPPALHPIARHPVVRNPVAITPIGVRPPDPLRDAAPAPAISVPASQPHVEEKDAPQTSKIATDDLLQLIWFDPKAVPRMRRHKAWRRILDHLEEQRHDRDIDDAVLDDDAMEVEDHRDTFELLSHAPAHRVSSLAEILQRGRSQDGRFVPPLALFAGQLRFPFDELETLKATISAAQPFAQADETLAAAIEDANAVVATPDLVAAPEVTRNHTKRISDAFRRVDRLVSKNYLEKQTQRALLEGRHYQRREVFGDEQLRALLLSSDERGGAVPTYLPAALAKQLPMFERFQVRLIATVEPTASQFEEHPVALRVAALGRVWRPKW